MPPFKRRIATIKDAGLYRTRSVCSGKTHVVRNIDKHSVVSFCSNDYLGLASDPRVIQALQKGAETYGVGSGASCLITGYTAAHQELEEYLAAFTHREAALLFPSGYMANLGVIQALVTSKQTVLADRLNHASLIDGVRLSGARLRRYTHANIHAVEKMFDTAVALLTTDAVFSMDGDLAPLPQLAELCRSQEKTLMVDDAHGFGVLGKTGRGTLEHFNLHQADVPILIGTFGKACGTAGAFVAGSQDFIEWLGQRARTSIYTTAQPAALACATLQSLKLIARDNSLRERLFHNIHYFHKLAQLNGLPIPKASSAIFPIHTKTSARAMALSAALLNDGFMVSAIRPPTVPPNSARLRITLSAQHKEKDIQCLVERLSHHYKTLQ